MDDELPGYFDDVEPEAAPPRAVLAPPRPAPRPWPSAELIPLAAAMRPSTPTTVVVQVVPVPPGDAARRLLVWASATAARPRPWFAGHDRLAVVPAVTVAPPAGGRSCCVWHVGIDVRSHARPSIAMEVGCAPWSATRAELHVVPARVVRDRRRYYRAAHAVLDRLVRELR